MNDEKRPEDLDQESQDDLDAFARALLNRKTEMRIFRDEESDEVEIGFSENDREEAERSMSLALDTLRKSRGQKTIGEEESAYWYEETIKDSHESSETADAAGEEIRRKNRNRPKPVKRRKKTGSHQEKPAKSASRSQKKDKPVSVADSRQKSAAPAEKNKARHARSEETDFPKQKAERKNTGKNRRHRLAGWIAAGCILLAAALGLYCWKVLVWNPENLVSEKQEASYMKLVDYADEYGSGLMSDAEKAEILDLKADYDGLASRQKTELDTYFRNQTKSSEYPDGRTFMEIWQEESDRQKAAEESMQPQFQQLSAYLTGWNDKTDAEKREITNYRDIYNGLSQLLKTQVDDQLKADTGKTFSQLVSEQEEAARSEQVEQDQQNDAQKADLQAQIDSLNAELQPYSEYGDSLTQELNDARMSGEDTTEIESQIAANDEYVQSLQQQISALQAQMAALQ